MRELSQKIGAQSNVSDVFPQRFKVGVVKGLLPDDSIKQNPA
jgi:ferredoxin-fold anticodon binding domain-containing protein